MASNTRILVGDDEWEPFPEDPANYPVNALIYEGPTFSINGVHMHLVAIPVNLRATIDDGEAYAIQEGAPGWEDEYEGLSKLDPDGAFQTHRIKGQDYVLVLHPYQS